MADYTSVARIRQQLRGSYDDSDDAILNTIRKAAETFLDTYCNRSRGGFLVQSYDRVLHGTGTHQIYMQDAPLQFIKRISTNRVPAIYVRNDDPDISTIATMSLTATNMTLTTVNGLTGTTTNALSFATYPSIQQLANAINALGNHWISGAMSGLQNRPSTELWAPQGSYGCRVTTAYGWTFYQHLPTFWFDPNETQGQIYSEMGFSRGVFNWRFQYDAGYPTFPLDLEQALVELVVATYYAREANANMDQESLGPYSYTRVKEAFSGLTDLSRKTLNQYKLVEVPKFSTW